MKPITKFTVVFVSALMTFGFVPKAQAAITVVKSASVSSVEATVSGVTQDLSIVVKNVSDNALATGGKLSFPAGSQVKTSTQYLEVSFQSKNIGAAVTISTNNRSAAANPAFASGKDGIIGTADDETFNPATGVSGAGMVGTAAGGHAFVVPMLWTVFDSVVPGGYTFVKDFGKEGVVTDKAQTHAFAGPNGSLIAQAYDSAANTSYASVAVGIGQDASGANIGLIANFPQDVDGTGPLTGLRSATSPIIVYMGVDYSGAPAQGYATNTLSLELINQ